jgi:hypothetical protein
MKLIVDANILVNQRLHKIQITLRLARMQSPGLLGFVDCLHKILTSPHPFLTHAHRLVTHAHDLVTHAYRLVTNAHRLSTQSCFLSTHYEA